MESQSIQSLPREAGAGHSAAYRYLESLLSDAGIQLDGTTRPWDMRLRRAGVAERILAQGRLGLWAVAWHHLRARWFNLQTKDRACWGGRSLRPVQ